MELHLVEAASLSSPISCQGAATIDEMLYALIRVETVWMQQNLWDISLLLHIDHLTLSLQA